MDELINFFMDPLRLTLIIAAVVVLLAIIIFSRKSSKRNEYVYSTPSKEFSFGSKGGTVSDALAQETLVDEEVIVLPRKQTESQRKQVQESLQQGTQQKSQKAQEWDMSEPLVEPLLKKQVCENIAEGNIEKMRVDEFRAFQASETQTHIGADVFEDDVALETKSPAMPQQVEKDAGSGRKTAQRQDPGVESVSMDTEKKDVAAHKEMFVVLHIIAIEGQPFNGLDILDATKTQGMAFGKHAIFHYPMSAAPAGDSKFCLVNMSATGNFETEKISSLETNGVSLIMRLPIRGADAQIVFANMVGVAHALARKLGGEILDQSRAPLTAAIIEKLREDIVNFDNSLKSVTAKEFSSRAATREAVPEI